MSTSTAAAEGLEGEIRSPVTGEVLGVVPPSSAEDVSLAVEQANAVFRTAWARDARLRAQALSSWADAIEERQQELAHLLAAETGKLLSETQFEVRGSVEALRYNGGMAAHVGGRAGLLPDGSTAHLERQPVGVCAFITPWNWPVLLLLRDLAPALAAGVTAVVKPAELTPLSTVEVLRLGEASGLPPGVVQVVHGGAEVGAALVEHPRIAAVAFTGSTAVGRKIMQASASTLKRTLLELGGKGCNLVFADADVDAVVPTMLRTAFISTGQMCMATTRILVERTRYSEVLDAVVEGAGAMTVGDPFDPSSDMGPLISRAHRASVRAHLDGASASGAVVTGGEMIDDVGPGAYISPAVVTDAEVGSAIVQEEVFGPVVTVEAFDGDDDAVELANGVQFGLAAGIWTADVKRAWSVARAVDAGSVWVNGYMRSFPEMPSGGFKQSGLGRTRGIEGIEQFTEMKHINWSA